MYNLLIGNYNNYFNRIVKKEETDFSYFTMMANTVVIKSINFNPNDGIATQVILGKGDYLLPESATNPVQPDYAILFTTDLENPPYADAKIISRWFIIETVRTRSGQYQLSLKRDVLVDNYNEVIGSPCYIEKATIDDLNNPLLYNNEDYKVNQIKTSENLIKDRSGVAWVVGYVSSKLSTETKDIPVTTVALNSSGNASGSTIYTASSNFIDIYVKYNGTEYRSGLSYTFNQSTGLLSYTIAIPSLASKSVELRVKYTQIGAISGKTYKTTIPGDESRNHLTDAPYDMFAIPFGEVLLYSANITTTKEAALEIAFEFAKDLGKESIYDIQLLPYCPRQNMILSGRVVEVFGTQGSDYNYIYDMNNNVKSIMIWCTKSSDSFVAEADSPVVISRELGNETSKTISGSDATLSKSSFSSTNASIRIENNIFKTVKVTGITSLVASKGSATDNISSFTGFTQSEDTGVVIISYTGTSFATGNHTGVSYTLNFSGKPFVNPVSLDYKISNECDVFRLISPNYSGQFEWSLAKSSGGSSVFDVDFTYKPFQPYIHVSPVFTKLYGQDFNDARGLICGGDFSMPIVTDAWTEYEVHNKTYQDVFDREIKNFDTQRFNSSSQAAIQGGVGIVTGGIIGAAGGAKVGGGIGAMVGGAIGTAAGTAGMIGDMYYMNQAYDEQRDFKIDMFNFGIQNIQALPYGLTKVAAYTQNNKIFPMVEYYTCTDIEKQAFKDKLKYNGMTVMVIGTINDYIDQNEKRFIKGQLIRLPNIKDDSHIVNEIYNEVNKGVYI